MMLRWVGGKSLLAEPIISIFPPHRRYIEPFFGAGWVFFSKPNAEQSIINDINKDLINLYLVVRDKPQDLARLIHYTPKHEAEFNRLLTLYNTEYYAKLTDVQRALVFYFLVKNSFNGLIKSFSVISTGWWGWGVLETVYAVHEKLKNTDILCRDWKDTITPYANDKDTLVYLDPPYALTINEKSYYYEYTMSIAQHKELRDFLVERKDKFYFVISYDIHPFVEALYQNTDGIYMHKTAEVFQSSLNKNTGIVQDRSSAFKSEYLITNYRIEEVSPLFFRR